jgi:D-alanyl-D-alanine carboxypeptidase (penicillin-binding protein 5/6)
VISKQPLIAPVAKGQEIGSIQFVIDGKVVDEQKLLAAKEVKVAGIFGRLWDSFMLLFA